MVTVMGSSTVEVSYPKAPANFYTLEYWQNKLAKNIENYEADKEAPCIE